MKKICNKKPWPTQEAMQQVYRNKLWGSNGEKYYSGDGSHHLDLVNPYITTVTKFLKSFQTTLTVMDLGCGDFNIGKKLVPFAKKYIAVDIVEELIDYNRRMIKCSDLEFHCLDIANDDLPPAEVLLLRQVLQHLSNAEIAKVVKKIYDYKYVILTEHLPEGGFIPNKDIISGQGTRLKKQSGVNLLAPPFCLKVKDKQQLLCLKAHGHGGIIVTTLFKMF